MDNQSLQEEDAINDVDMNIFDEPDNDLPPAAGSSTLCEELPQNPSDVASVNYFNGVEISKLTKRQQKKYKKFLKWQDVKKEKRAKEKERLKEKRKLARINNISLGPSRKALKMRTMEASTCKISVCIDLSFDYLMIDKDMAKTAKQILRVYTENRRALAPMQLYLTNFNGRSKRELERYNGYQYWDMVFHDSDYMDVFPKEKLIYLTSDSDNVIRELQDDRIYIIGGLVDHNAHKGICYNKALTEGIAHGRLPISEYFWMKQRKVLTINQVFEILIRVSEGMTFKDAFELILPKRKEIVSLKSNKIEEQSEVAENGDIQNTG
ncbi:tRNA methyltransferase 10 homolog A [Euwallacea similis]|uniref:tRNA methyltransferase 10 homolog A n=1 Tax=Euwallacea similis TaxID=1736056 RepID=UPI00345010BD